MEKKDLQSCQDIQLLIEIFYEKVKEDELLGDIFKELIQDNWKKHIGRMSVYWNALILEKKNPYELEFQKYARLPIRRIYFDRWTSLFFDAVNENFFGKNADEAKLKAIQIALSFQSRYRQNNIMSEKNGD